ELYPLSLRDALPISDGQFRFAAHQSISMKNMAAKASIRMTREMVCTTLEVVRSPTDWAVPCTWKPSRQPIRAMTVAKTGALDRRSEEHTSELQSREK